MQSITPSRTHAFTKFTEIEYGQEMGVIIKKLSETDK